MNGYNFTDRVRKVLQMAREEASRLHHEYVGTEHILLGLIREGEGVAAAVLTNLNVDLDEIQQRIEETVKKGKAPASSGPDLPYTSRATRSLSFEETMNLLSGVRLGVGLNLISDISVYTLNKLLIFAQPAHLAMSEGRELGDSELGVARAAYTRQLLEEDATR